MNIFLASFFLYRLLSGTPSVPQNINSYLPKKKIVERRKYLLSLLENVVIVIGR